MAKFNYYLRDVNSEGETAVILSISSKGERIRLKTTFSIEKRFWDFETIDYDFYIDFKTYMEKNLRFSNNTIGRHIKQLKTVLNEATEIGINTNLKYKSKKFITIRESVNNTYLNESELNDFQKLNLSKNPRLEKVRDLFKEIFIVVKQ